MYFDRLSQQLGAEFHHYFQISIKYRYVYVSTPKVACTSLKSALMRLELMGHGLPHAVETAYARPHRGYLDSGFVKPFQMGARVFDEFVSRPDVMVFAVSRDPFSRALAGYLDKVVTGTPIFDTVKEELASIRGTDVDAVTPESVSFAEHLTALEMKPGSLAMNAHFRPQAAHIGFGATPFTHVFRIEEFTALESALADHLGVDNFRVGRTGAHATNSAQRLGDYYGPSTIKQVLRLFADDFDAFGYPRKLAESR